MTAVRTFLNNIRGTDGVPRISKAAAERGESICGFCCAKDFCAIAVDEGLQECPEAVLPIKFNTMKGTEDRFSTIRFGKSFSDRLRPGSIIGLFNTETGSVEGFAEVEEAICLDREDALTRGAENNHTNDPTKPVEDRRHKLWRTVRNSYGSYTTRDDALFTHIECRRLTDEELKRFEETWPVDFIAEG
tara:strand:+ start:314 stop:880 length:567 start_codon:yes stop_codon:yes gene_type:complete